MTPELLKAVKDCLEHLRFMRRLVSNTTMITEIEGEIDRLEPALTAYIAEIRERREKSPWNGPFKAHFYDATGTWAVIDNCKKIGFVCEVGEEAQRVTPIIAALNEHFGFSADGSVDYLEDKP